MEAPSGQSRREALRTSRPAIFGLNLLKRVGLTYEHPLLHSFSRRLRTIAIPGWATGSSWIISPFLISAGASDERRLREAACGLSQDGFEDVAAAEDVTACAMLGDRCLYNDCSYNIDIDIHRGGGGGGGGSR